MTEDILRAVAIVLAIIGVMFALGFLHVGCFPAAKEVEAALGYEAQQMRCVDQYAKRADIDRCRARVAAAWAPADAGAEGGDQ